MIYVSFLIKYVHSSAPSTGVVDIADNFPYGKDEIQLQLTDRGRALGMSIS